MYIIVMFFQLLTANLFKSTEEEQRPKVISWRVHSGFVVQCLTRDGGAPGSIIIVVTALCL